MTEKTRSQRDVDETGGFPQEKPEERVFSPVSNAQGEKRWGNCGKRGGREKQAEKSKIPSKQKGGNPLCRGAQCAPGGIRPQQPRELILLLMSRMISPSSRLVFIWFSTLPRECMMVVWSFPKTLPISGRERLVMERMR